MGDQQSRRICECREYAKEVRKQTLLLLMRRPSVWLEQILVAVLGLLKASLCLVVISLLVQCGLGWPENLATLYAAFCVSGTLLLNPANIFFQNLFSQRADRAYEQALRLCESPFAADKRKIVKL